MDLTQYEIEDFLVDETFINYCLRCDDQDVVFWESWISTNPANKSDFNQAVSLFAMLNGGRNPSQLEADNKSFEIRLKNHVKSGLEDKINTTNIRAIKSQFYRIAAAAVIFVVFAAGLFFYVKKHENTVELAANSNKLMPGRNTATLTLADGRKITLSEAAKGKFAIESGANITKTGDGQIVYQPNNESNNEGKYNTLSTAKGEQYQVILPDSTKVWLNASSAIKYPPTFKGLDERKVELSGEAYFEVAKDQKHPFMVTTASQEIRVLGTHFNINAYADELFTKTTLLEGKVSLHAITGKATIVIKPGEEARLHGDEFKVLNVDPEEATAWKDGYFRFEDEQLESIMRKVSRWYGATIVFETPELRKRSLSGLANRYANVSELLATLALTKQVSFKISGKTIIISPYHK